MIKEKCLDFKTLVNLIEKYNIPEDVELWSDSGWECSATRITNAFYNKKRNVIVFTQYMPKNVYRGIGDIHTGKEIIPKEWKHLKL